MSQILIRPIAQCPEITFAGDQAAALPADIRQKVDDYWLALTQANPRLHNGEVFTVTSITEDGASIHITLAETNYAHYLYSQQVGGLGKYQVRVIHPVTLVLSKDDKLIFGRMADHTSLAGSIECCGGGIDHDDVEGGVVHIDRTAAKELAEELGIDVNDKTQVTNFEPKFLKTGGPTDKMTVIFTARLDRTGSEFIEQYDEFVKQLKATNQEAEFSEIFCLDRDAQSVKAFMSQHPGQLGEYFPALLNEIIVDG
jgi:8-oxo-dGTP pyrophosphatase MutT (NUDIX family)